MFNSVLMGMNEVKTLTKLNNLYSSVKSIENGDTIALGGFMMHNNPMAIVREIIRQKKKNLSLIISPSAGFAADLLIGAGCISEIRSTYVGLDHLGLAPCFRQAVQNGELKVLEYDEVTVVAGLRAGAGRLPFIPVTSITGSDILKVNPELQIIKDPLNSSRSIVAVPPLIPDVAILHVQEADERGNAYHDGSRFVDVLMARAAKKVIITSDELISKEKWCKTPGRTTLHGFHIDHLIHLPGSAYPCSSHGRYIHDEEHIKKYIGMVRNGEFSRYIEQFVNDYKEEEAIRLTERLQVDSISKNSNIQSIDNIFNYSTAELIAVVLSRELKDGETGGVGANSAIPIAAARLAQLRHAPNMNFVLSGGGMVNTKSNIIYPSSTDCRYYLNGAESIMELGNDFFDLVEQGPDFFFFSGIQIDKHGNFNLHCIGDWNKPRFRGPGLPSVGATVNAKKFFLYSTKHSKRQFVEKCDFLSGPGFLNGYKDRFNRGLTGGGPALCVTDLGVFDFDDESKRMRVKSVHPGISISEIVENTGFELVIPDDIQETNAPSTEELTLLRTLVDSTGVLRNLK